MGMRGILTWDGEPFEYLADAWTEADCKKLAVVIGSCQGQAVWEALALLIAMRTWAYYWSARWCIVRVKSDSKAALGAMEKERSKASSMNLIARELSLDRALAEREPLYEFGHVRGKSNEWGDALSRLAQPGSGAVVPPPLDKVTRRNVQSRGAGWWRTCWLQQVPL